MADQTLSIDLDDSEFLAGLKRSEAALKDVEDEAEKVGKTTTKSFNDGSKAIKKFNKDLGKTEKQMGKTEKEGKKLKDQIRGFQRNFSLARFALIGGIGAISGAFSAIGEGVKVVADAFRDLFGTTTNQDRINKQIQKSLGDVTNEFVKEKTALDRSFDALRNTNEGTEERREAIERINTEYKEYLPNLLDEKSDLDAIQAAQNAATASLIKNIAAKQKSIVQEELFQKLFQNNISLIELRNKKEAEGLSDLGELTLQAGEVIEKALTDQLNSLDEFEKGFVETLSAVSVATGDMSKGLENTNDTLDETTKKADGTAKATEVLAGSMKDLQAQLAEVNKQINETAETTDEGALLPLINQAKDLEAEIKKAEAIIKRLRGEIDETAEQREERLKKQGELVAQLLLDETQQRVFAAQQEAKARKESINKIVKDDERKAQLLAASDAKLQADIDKALDDQENARQQKQTESFNNFLSAKNEGIEQEIALDEAKLRRQQALELAASQLRGDSAEQQTAIQERQEVERQRLTLESERKRLNTVLQFSEGRTEAEVEATKALVDAVNAELDNLGEGVTDTAAGPGGSPIDRLLGGLGLDEAGIGAVKQGISTVVSELSNLFAERARLAQEAVNLRNQEIIETQTQIAAEIQLNKQGAASNIEALQNQLEQQQKARAQALEQQKRAQKAQQAIETIQQTVSLITAAANIFQSLSGLPLGIGVPIAVAVVGAMFGAFIATKAQAAKASKLAKGGKLNGPSHAKGGIAVSVGGERAPSYEAEGGEWVINKGVSAEHDGFIDRLNAGEYSGMDLEQIARESRKTKSLKITANNRDTAIKKRNEQIQRDSINAAIREQTGILSEGLTAIYRKPQIVGTQNGYIEYRETGNGKIVRKHNIKQ